jgi:hypothetical protein
MWISRQNIHLKLYLRTNATDKIQSRQPWLLSMVTMHAVWCSSETETSNAYHRKLKRQALAKASWCVRGSGVLLDSNEAR